MFKYIKYIFYINVEHVYIRNILIVLYWGKMVIIIMELLLSNFSFEFSVVFVYIMSDHMFLLRDMS